MSKSHYFFAMGASQLVGPFRLEEIENLVLSSRVSLADMVYEQGTARWVAVSTLLSQTGSSYPIEYIMGLMPAPSVASSSGDPQAADKALGELSLDVKDENKTRHSPGTLGVKPGSLRSVNSKSPSADHVIYWHMKEGPFELGPYSFLSMMAMYRDGTLTDEHQVRQSNSKVWQKVSRAFSREDKKFFSALVPVKKEQVVRKGPENRGSQRASLEEIFFVHDGVQQHIVQGFDIASGGIAFLHLSPLFKVGQAVSCQFVPRPGFVHVVTGKILRVERTASQNFDLDLFKYVIVADRPIDLSLFNPKDSSED